MHADTRVAPPANPGLNGTATLLDTTTLPNGATTLTNRGTLAKLGVRRALVTILADQVVTFKASTIATGSTTWRVYNGSGSGEATTANVFFERDVLLMGDDALLTIVCTTAPTVWEVTISLVTDRALAQ